MIRRGTSRSPGADPRRLPTGLDLRAVSLVEGVRAGLAASVPVMASVWLHQPVLTLAALGALLTCICDPAGPLRRRVPILLAFVLLGGLFMGGFGMLRALGVWPCLAAAVPLLFACGYARVWGAPAQALGNLLAVVLLLGTDTPLSAGAALRVGGVFVAGGAWALLLTLVIWRIHPFGPARRAVADVWAELGALARTLQSLCEMDAAMEAWEGHARSGRGGVRAAIERARETLMDTVDQRGPASGPAAQNLLRLEVADQIFVGLIALSDALERETLGPRLAAVPLLRRLRAMMVVMATATEREKLPRPARFTRTLAAIEGDAALPAAMRPLARLLAEQLRLAAKYVDPAQYLPGSGKQGDAGMPLRIRLLTPLRANATWASASMRHAARIACVVAPALAATLVWHNEYTHWLTITLVLVMQPFFATTWQRSLERIGGTLLGGAVAGGLSALVHTQMHVAGVLPVLGALALAVRQVSYGVYIAVYTPTVIFLVESLRPGESQLHIALARAGFTVLGGLLAVAANMLLWPIWEPDRVRADLRAALAAHAGFAAAVLHGGTQAEIQRTRRAAGLSSNNLEASLARAMQEPRRGQRDALQAALVADATLRRVAGRLVAISLEGPCRTPVCQWVPGALAALAEARPIPEKPDAPAGDMVERLARQIMVLPEVLARAEGGREPDAGARLGVTGLQEAALG